MPIKYKINILEELEKKGYNTYTLRRDGVLSQATIENLRKEKPISFDTLGKICEILNLQPADIIEYLPDPKRIDPDPDKISEYFQDEKNLEHYKQWLNEQNQNN